MEGKEPPFQCRVCGGKTYVVVNVLRPSGSWYRTPFYRCFDCSTMFTNPIQFGGNMVTGDGIDRSPRRIE